METNVLDKLMCPFVAVVPSSALAMETNVLDKLMCPFVAVVPSSALAMKFSGHTEPF
jgi:hypothetical protein